CIKAKEDIYTTKQQALLAICPEFGALWTPPPATHAEGQLAAAAQKLRQLQTQQGKIKAQLVAAAQSQKELPRRLSENVEQRLAAQAEVDSLVGETIAGAATPSDQEKPREETEFPELGADDLETLGAEGKREYEEATKAAAEASATLKQDAAKEDEQGARAENLDFTYPDAVNKYIEATAQFKAK
ncbi:unnamed protein product, partial [Prorocentrum cordatum]